MYVATIHRLHYKGQKSKTRNFAVYISHKPVTLKQSQGHQTYNGNVDPKQGYNHAKFERSCFNGVSEEANLEVVVF